MAALISEMASSMATLDLCFKCGEMANDTGVLKFHITRFLKKKLKKKLFFFEEFFKDIIQKNLCVSTQREKPLPGFIKMFPAQSVELYSPLA